MKWVLAFILMSGSVLAADSETDVKVAVALAKAKALAPKEKSLTYLEAREKAVRERKDLVVWVGTDRNLELPNAIQVSVPENFFGRGKTGVMVGKWVAGELFVVPDVNLFDSAETIKSKIRDFQPFRPIRSELWKL